MTSGQAAATPTSVMSSRRFITRSPRRRGQLRQPLHPAQSTAADGPEGLKAFIAFLKDKFPNNRSEIKRIFADGDYVIVHVHAVRERGTRGNAIVDIFKLENGKVVEHWDVIQPIPENAANNNGMF
jgi:predicted SnoaL-like aldol condensation-catalyzing enzyme